MTDEPLSPRVAVRLLRRPRRFGAVNWVGLATLYRREARRGLKDHLDSLWGPVVANLLYLAVFGLAAGTIDQPGNAGSLLAFIAPGLVMFTIMSRAFEMACASILFDKLEGMIVDVLQPPITPIERLTGMAGACVSVGLLTGIVLALVTHLFVDMRPVAPLTLLLFAVLGALMLSLAGILGGLWARRWDHYAALLTFFVIPASFLSGMFYPIDVLPEFARDLTLINPLFYAIDGVRYGFRGEAQASLAVGAALLIAINAALALVLWRLFSRGWRLKS
ncbi:MAG: ABC transporter permease [Rhodospirillaceae bacterium]|nr:ABC transporter permease [Rhodospirillaceae bacterium]